MESVLVALIIVFLYIWGIATIFYQFKLTSRYVGKWNYFALVPKWTFFAPLPKTTDYDYYYQDKLADADEPLGPPVRIDFEPRNGFNSRLSMFWNPQKRNEKALTDLMHFILDYKTKYRDRIKTNPLVLEIYTPYILLLNFVSHLAPPAEDDCQRKFLVYSSYGHYPKREPALTFESVYHELDA